MSWPLAIICVPTRRLISPECRRLQQALHVAAGADGVAVHAADARIGKELLQPLFALLRARAEVVQVLGLALGAGCGHGAPIAAVVALQPLAGVGDLGVVGRLVIRQRDRAVLALELFAAAAAHHDEAVAAAVEQDDDLLAAIERGLRLFEQAAGEELFLAGDAELLAHVDHLDLRQRPLLHALEHLHQRVAAALGIVPALERGRRGAEDDCTAEEFRAHHGDVATVVARCLLLLIAAVVLLVDENQAEVGHGCEDGRARADNDARLTATDAVPLLGAFVGRELRVQ